jgi:hypothetical protein
MNEQQERFHQLTYDAPALTSCRLLGLNAGAKVHQRARVKMHHYKE